MYVIVISYDREVQELTLANDDEVEAAVAELKEAAGPDVDVKAIRPVQRADILEYLRTYDQ